MNRNSLQLMIFTLSTVQLRSAASRKLSMTDDAHVCKESNWSDILMR